MKFFVLSHRLPNIARRGTAAPPHAGGAPLDGGDGETRAEVGVPLEDVVGAGQKLREFTQLRQIAHSNLIHSCLGVSRQIYRWAF